MTTTFFNEMYDAAGAVRSHYQAYADWLAATPEERIARKRAEADIAFHKAILVATHNVVIQQLSDAISALQRAIFDYTLFAADQHMALTLKEHFDLFEAIRRQNPEAAERHSHTMVQRTAVRAQQSAAAPEDAAVPLTAPS